MHLYADAEGRTLRDQPLRNVTKWAELKHTTPAPHAKFRSAGIDSSGVPVRATPSSGESSIFGGKREKVRGKRREDGEEAEAKAECEEAECRHVVF